MQSWLSNLSSLEFWLNILEHFRSFGWLAPICLACLESFFPALPLLAIISFNLAVYGLIEGAAASWIGTTLGSVLVFILFRKAVKPVFSKMNKSVITKKAHFPILNELNVLLLYCCPFAPGNLLNVVLGCSDFASKSFFKAVLFGKAGLVLLVAAVNVMGYHFLKSWQGWLAVGMGLSALFIIKRKFEIYFKMKEE